MEEEVWLLHLQLKILSDDTFYGELHASVWWTDKLFLSDNTKDNPDIKSHSNNRDKRIFYLPIPLIFFS